MMSLFCLYLDALPIMQPACFPNSYNVHYKYSISHNGVEVYGDRSAVTELVFIGRHG